MFCKTILTRCFKFSHDEAPFLHRIFVKKTIQFDQLVILCRAECLTHRRATVADT